MTDSSRHERIEDLFQRAADLPTSERAAFLDAECGGDLELRERVERLFRHHDDGMSGFLDSPPVTLLRRRAADISDELVGTLGRYRIVRLLGEGGMGAVYEAEQDQPRRVVALKVIHRRVASPQLVRRFEREAEILGRLQHPGIAHIYDAGRLDGAGDRPFLAMELVRGLPLLEYVRAHALSAARRLELVARICDGVAHAHDNGVIHRDLKPANILVDAQGQPKILDFGIARFVEHDAQMSTLQTDPGQILGTVAYMSPEQIAGNSTAIDRATDVYAIGVILFQLLSERLPYALQDKSLPESARIIQEDEPASIGSINTRFRGDIETIVAKALEKDRSRRYAAAGELAADIRRHLAEQPIHARPQTTLYRIRKFARRHRGLVGATVAIIMTLVAGIVGMTVFAVRESAQRTRAERLLESEQNARQTADALRVAAEREAEKANATVEFIRSTLSYADPDRAPGKPLTVVEALDRAGEELASLSDQPAVVAAVEYVMGNAYRALGDVDKARQHLRHGLELRREQQDLAGVAESLYSLARVHIGLAEYEQARALSEEAVETYGRVDHQDPLALADTKHVLAQALDGVGRYEDSLALLREVLEIQQRHVAQDDPLITETLNSMAYSLVNLRRFDEAEALYRQTIAEYRERKGSDNSYTVAMLHNLASLMIQLGRYEEARAAAEESLQIARRVLGPTHPTIANVASILADVAIRQDRFEEALTLSEATLVARRNRLGSEHGMVATTLAQYGYILRRLNRLDQAEAALRESLDIRRKLLGENHPHTAYSMYRVVDVLIAAGKLEEAKPLAEDCLAVHLSLYGPDNVAVQKSRELVDSIAAAEQTGAN